MKIPFVDLGAQYRAHQAELDAAIRGVLETTAFIGGKPVKQFEEAYAKEYGVKHCISCANGTDAIYVVLRMLGIGVGDEVITTAASWISTSETIGQTGAMPVFVDVDEHYNIDVSAIERAITPRTRAIIPVHLYGQAARMDAIVEIAQRRSLKLIEDCAQAHFAEYGGKRVGTFGNAATFSFYPGKNLGAYGDAGAIVTNDDDLAKRCRMYANHGALVKHQHEMEGINSRLDGLQAAVLSAKLPHIHDWTKRRQAVAAEYRERLRDVPGVFLPEIAPNATHVFHLFVVRVPNRDGLRDHLGKLGIETGIHYPTALPFLGAYRDRRFEPGQFPRAHRNQGEILSLPIYPEMTSEMVAYVADGIRGFIPQVEIVTKAYINFSVHEGLFHRMAERLRAYGVTEFAGFAWGKAQQRTLSNLSINYDLLVFTQDLLPKHGDAPPDLAWLQQRERELGVSIERMLSAERHLLEGRTWEQIMRMVEVALREIAATYDRVRPDFVFSDDVSCFHSYAHFVLARERGIPFWCIGGARLPYRVAIYSEGLQHWEGVTARYAEYRRRGLTPQERAPAEEYAKAFRDKPNRPSGMAVRAGTPGFGLADLATLRASATRYWSDPDDPTSMPPWEAIPQRVRRVARIRGAKLLKVFEQPVDGEKYVLYPIHFQPEASTLVQAPMYLDQLALIQDIARSLPIGHRLYVKEHLSNRGRRPLEFYNAIRAIPSVRLLGPDANTWSLIQNASAVAVITGTMGWEALFFDKPVITFGDVFYNAVPTVYRAGAVPKDGWYEVFQRAITSHVPDREALITYLAAMQAASFPGFIANPATFPEVVLDDNIDLLVQGLVTAAGLAPTTSRAPSAARSHPHQ